MYMDGYIPALVCSSMLRRSSGVSLPCCTGYRQKQSTVVTRSFWCFGAFPHHQSPLISFLTSVSKKLASMLAWVSSHYTEGITTWSEQELLTDLKVSVPLLLPVLKLSLCGSGREILEILEETFGVELEVMAAVEVVAVAVEVLVEGGEEF